MCVDAPSNCLDKAASGMVLEQDWNFFHTLVSFIEDVHMELVQSAGHG